MMSSSVGENLARHTELSDSFKWMNSRKLLKEITCPYCWRAFQPGDIVWIAESPDLVGDFRIGEAGAKRFLPVRFDEYGNAIDSKGAVCRKIACPHCHLPIPQSLLEMPPFFVSIVGAPASGKSYFLASMTWTLRRKMPDRCALYFTDADQQLNQHLQNYESLLFVSEDENQITQIDKTEEQGDLYHTVITGGHTVTYPHPFIFSVSPTDAHKNSACSAQISTSLCMYDNAGESYLPVSDSDKMTLPVTRHLGKSNCIFFLFDPLQDPRFREACRQVSNDPQLDQNNPEFRKSPIRQETVLAEMINRTKTYRNMQLKEKYTNPVYVIVTKADAWRKLIPEADFSLPIAKNKNGHYFVRKNKINEMSNHLRSLLQKKTPEMVSLIEQFASNVTYIPVSATGNSPIVDPETHTGGFRAKDIRPMWVEVPILYALATSKRGIIPTTDQ